MAVDKLINVGEKGKHEEEGGMSRIGWRERIHSQEVGEEKATGRVMG